MQGITVEIIPDLDLGGFTARVPDIPAYGEGPTEEEAIADLKKALRAYVEAFGLDEALARLNPPTSLRHFEKEADEQAGRIGHPQKETIMMPFSALSKGAQMLELDRRDGCTVYPGTDGLPAIVMPQWDAPRPRTNGQVDNSVYVELLVFKIKSAVCEHILHARFPRLLQTAQ